MLFLSKKVLHTIQVPGGLSPGTDSRSLLDSLAYRPVFCL